ncbi:MAG TPA: mitochondrial fission ELM1 family protein, partial [Alphaproteobacteria bacterium]
VCWIITEGLIGTQNQCLALAQALACQQPMVKKIHLRAPWKWVTPYIRAFSPLALTSDSDSLAGPWPDIIIASGRKAIAASLWVKKQSKDKAVLVVVQNPVIKSKHFDLVITPQHDAYDAPNAFQTSGALSHLTPAKLEAAKLDFSGLSHMPSPRIAVLIGGTSRTHRLTKEICDQLIAQLLELQAQKYSLLITASRRTPLGLLWDLRHALQGSSIVFWDGTGNSPYLAYLAYADIILVTEDSVSMASEAISTGKPVYIIKMEGGSPRFKRFHDHLVAHDYARWFDGQIAYWRYQPPADLANAAARVKKILLNKAA